jgi:lactate dehydrogenase-like 2-hydroxyacid dehydrogenase
MAPSAKTTKPDLLVTRRMPPDVTDRAERDYAARLNPDDRIYTADEIVKGAEGCQALLVFPGDKVGADTIQRLPAGIRAIATFSVGYDHIDLKAAKARGIPVTNTPDVLTDATADIAIMLMIGAARRAAEGDAMVRANQWKTWHTMFMLGRHVTGQRLGIFGMGRIGQAVAKRARGFDMKIHYHGRNRLPPAKELGATYHQRVEDLLAVSDFLTLHCPSSPETRGFLNATRIAALPDGAVVVNTARGDIVDDAALIAALKSGKLAAAGLDVFAGEPNINPGYRDLKNTFLLPHLGSATLETRNAMGFTALDNLDAIFAGRTPPNLL